MPSRFPTLLCASFAIGLALPADAVRAEGPDESVNRETVSAAAEPLQFYVFSFTETPVAEAAQDVVVGALALDLVVDPAVDGVVTFRADGWYGSNALLQDFGAALLDQDIALVRSGPGSYTLAPRANLPMLLARGGVLMTLPDPASARSPEPVLRAADPVVYGRARWWEGAMAALSLFMAGAIAGAAALFGGQAMLRRARRAQALAAPVLRITDQRVTAPVDLHPGDPDLVIPRFRAPSDS